MVQPINYLGGVGAMQATNPVQSLAQGLQSGMSLRAMRDQRDQRLQAKARIDAFRTAMSQGRDVDSMINEFPEFADQVMKIHGFRDERDMKQTRQDMAELTGAMTLGKEATLNYFDKQRKAFENAGNDEGVAQVNRSQQAYLQNPTRFAQSIAKKHRMLFPKDASLIAGAEGVLGETKLAPLQLQASIEKNKIEAKKAETAAKNATTAEEKNRIEEKRVDLENEIKQAQLELDKHKAGKPSPGKSSWLQKLGEKAETARATNTKANDLLKKIDGIDRLTGAPAKAAEFWKDLWGTQDEASSFRTELIGVINEAVRNQRKPGEGTMSDNDYKVLRAAAPDADSSPDIIKDYLKRLRRFSAYSSARADLEADWVDVVGTTGRYRGDDPIEIGGFPVKKGTNFNKFMRDIDDEVFLEASRIPENPEDAVNLTDEEMAEVDALIERQ